MRYLWGVWRLTGKIVFSYYPSLWISCKIFTTSVTFQKIPKVSKCFHYRVYLKIFNSQIFFSINLSLLILFVNFDRFIMSNSNFWLISYANYIFFSYAKNRFEIIKLIRFDGERIVLINKICIFRKILFNKYAINYIWINNKFGVIHECTFTKGDRMCSIAWKCWRNSINYLNYYTWRLSTFFSKR